MVDDTDITLVPISDIGYQKLRKNYIAAAAKGMAASSDVTPAEFSNFIETQLTAVLEQDRENVNAFFLEIVLTLETPMDSRRHALTIESKDAHIQRLQDGRRVTVGTLSYRLHPNTHFSDMALITWLGVDATYRRRGFAKATIKLLSSQLKPMGINKLSLEVFNKNASAHHLYRSIGFKSQRTVMELSI